MNDLGALFNKRLELKMELAECSKREKLLKEGVDAIDAQLKKFLYDSDVDKVAKDGFTAKIATKTGTKVEDWDKLYQYITENNRFDMLQRRLVVAPFKEAQENEQTIPGVEIYDYTDLSVTRTG